LKQSHPLGEIHRVNTVIYDYQIFGQQKFGGISRYFCEIATRIGSRPDWNVRIVAPVHYNQYLAESELPTVGLFLKLPHVRFRRLYGWTNRFIAPQVTKLLNGSVLHETYYSGGKRASGTPKVITVYDMIHEIFPQCFRSDDPTRARKRASIDAADHVICISHRTALDLENILGVPPAKISVVHLGFSQVFAADRRLTNGTNGARSRPYVLYVGDRAGYKNFSGLLKAFAMSTRTLGSFDLIAFGGGPFSQREIAEIQDLAIRPDAVRQYSGDDRTLADFYRNARAFIYPSEYEGFGIPPLEAMACDCPVACSNTSSIPEVVGTAGEYFEPTSVDAMSAALERVCFDESRRTALIHAGRLQRSLFSWNKCADETVQVYRRML